MTRGTTMTHAEAQQLVRAAQQASPDERADACSRICALLEMGRDDLARAFEESEDAYIVERLVLRQEGSLLRTRAELVQVVASLQAAAGSVAQTDEWLRLLRANLPPGVPITDLIYHSELRSPDDVLDAAVSYQPRMFYL